ncbi:hypothetical protein NM688_g4396 [Phlebia brevispora]|uniref:Uncharacterized protein n=1 Tax=Phlebia brevispora TaxID=194682 RepID=A0ACC1T2R7_9APHY|nr:hypothetical protein NM688_g4396 [Phlebia brevispora]
MSGHLPAVRARHQKYLLARLARDADNVVEDDALQFSTSIFTAVETVTFPDRTLTETEVFTVLSPIIPGAPITQVPSVVLPTNASPTTTTTTTSSPTTSSSTTSSANSSSSSAPPSSSTSGNSSSSSPASAATSAPTTSVTPSSGLTSSGSGTAKGASITPSLSGSAAIASKSSALDDSNASTNSQSSGLSGGAVAGIVVAVIVVAIFVAIYAVRKIFLRRRQNRRISWGDAYPKPDFKEDFNEKRGLPGSGVPPPVPEKPITPIAPRDSCLGAYPGSPSHDL